MRSHGVFAFAALGALHAVTAQDEPPASPRLTVGVVAAKASAAAWLQLLRDASMLPRLVDVAECAPERLRTADVVLVDWPGDDPLGDRLPLGAFERWDRPTVFVGASGELFAQRWGLPTAATMAAMADGARGPEMQRTPPPADATAIVWRQGNLFHFGGGVGGAPVAAADRTWLVTSIARASRFVTDRPVLRHGVRAGGELPAAERARRERLAAGCAKLGIDPADRAALLALPDRDAAGLDIAAPAPFAALLADLVPDSRDAEATRNNWNYWFAAQADALAWDPLSLAWRVDPLARWRRVPTAGLRGDARADGDERSPEALALAAKVVQHHGGRALADLATFSCWIGEMHLMWDRRRGYLRAENHHVLRPGVRATAWKVAVADTAADDDVIQGGGPAGPRIGARSFWRDLVERAFLPAMLLDPGTSLRRVPEQDADGKQALGVRLAGLGMNLTAEHVLLVDPATGAIARARKFEHGRLQIDARIVATASCGPLLLPVEQVDERRTGPRPYTIVDPKWNPELPADLTSATERLSTPRAK